MTEYSSLEIMDAHWASLYKAPGRTLRSGIFINRNTTNVPSAGRRIHLFRRGATLLVVGPQEFDYETATALVEQPVGSLNTEPWVRASRCPVEKVIGPAWIGVADATALSAEPRQSSARVLTPEDVPALRRMAAATSPEEWEHGALDEEQAIRYGLFDARSGDLVAAAGYQIWAGNIAHICVATHPARRGLGFGRVVVSSATRHALDAGLVPQYRTLHSNAPSVKLAQRLGFRFYGETLTLYLACG